MKLSYRIALLAIALQIFITGSYGQQASRDPETYSRQHMAFTNFRLLGINKTQYARSVESVNMQQPTLRQKVIVINNEQFVDNGEKYDLVANDGILTSQNLYNYSSGVTSITPGSYRSSAQDAIVCDVAFSHAPVAGKGGPAGSSLFTCKIRWQKCTELPSELIALCKFMAAPFDGGLQIIECTFVLF